MAFITPVVRKDFNLYSKKKSNREQKRREPMEMVPEIAQNDGRKTSAGADEGATTATLQPETTSDARVAEDLRD
ncbi:hypothetical protein ANCCAN_00310 [Ancylostoma caninum]|uniref:Uncharacterized protein n=1 Tax=Ancylostoma caninum TaxID=29170 RepID=A0A368HB96_ANCCA|nr:hypothetical protein ANCCAN_00310 [Ancylostoma caninum]